MDITLLAQVLAGLVVSITVMILLVRQWKVHAFLALVAASLIYGTINGNSLATTLQIMQNGFGSLLAQIGLLVVLGSILGMMLEKSGAIEVISVRLLQLFGVRRAVPAMTVIGALTGIPVFCDSGFIILSRVIRPLSKRTAVSPASLGLGLAAGLYTTHTLVPPTPGPLAAAANLGAANEIGLVMLVGMVVSIPVVVVSSFFATRMGGRIVTNEPEPEDISTGVMASWKAFLPLLLPVVLIALASLIKISLAENAFTRLVMLLGIPSVALAIGIATAIPLMPPISRSKLPEWMSVAIKDAGVILLITGAGGGFGALIKASGVDHVLMAVTANTSMGGAAFLCLGYAVGALLKTAQGSTTSSMIITSTLLAPLAASAGLQSPVDIALMVTTIGGGAMTVSHANDSYFWVISQFGNISSQDLLKSFTLLSLLQGLTTLIASIILFLVL